MFPYEDLVYRSTAVDEEEDRDARKWTFTLQPRQESGLDCLMRALFARQWTVERSDVHEMSEVVGSVGRMGTSCG